MATHWSLHDVTEGWSKWQIAACVGAPIALGLAGIWFYRRNKLKSKAGNGDGKSEKSKSQADEPQSPKEQAQVAKNKGNKYFKGGMFDQAIECYTEAIRICPAEFKQDISTFYQNRAAAYENLKNYQQVVSDCSMALELNQQYIKAFTRRAKAFDNLEQYREALEDITTVCILESFQNPSSLQFADRVLKELGRSRARKAYQDKKPTLPSKFTVRNYFAGFANDPLLLVNNIGKVGDWVSNSPDVKEKTTDQTEVKQENGEDLKKEEIQASGDDNSDENGDGVLLEKPSAFERAKEAMDAGNYAEVITLCTEEINTPDSALVAEALLLRGTFYVLCAQGDKGLEDLDQLLKREGVHQRIQATALIRKGSLLMQKDQQKEALDCFAHAEKIDSRNSDVYHHRGQQHLLLERLNEAIADFEKSIALSPNFPTSYVQKGFSEHRRAMMMQSQIEMDTAKKTFEETLKTFPKCSDAYMLYGQSLCDLGQFDEADKQFLKALELEPDNANTVVHRGLLLLQWKADTEEAVRVIRSALELDPLCEYAYEILGTVSVQRGDMESAVEMFEKAIALSKSESEMAHLYSLLDAAQVQMKVAKKLGIPIPLGGGAAGGDTI